MISERMVKKEDLLAAIRGKAFKRVQFNIVPDDEIWVSDKTYEAIKALHEQQSKQEGEANG